MGSKIVGVRVISGLARPSGIGLKATKNLSGDKGRGLMCGKEELDEADGVEEVIRVAAGMLPLDGPFGR